MWLVYYRGYLENDFSISSFQSVFKQHLEKFKKVADGNSRAICNNRLRELNFRILKKKNNKAYCTPTGYDEYMADVEWIVKQFRKERKYLGTQVRPPVC